MARVNECGHADRKHVGNGKCSACYHKWDRERKGDAEKRRRRDYRLVKDYGLTADQVDEIFRLQGHACMLCMRSIGDVTQANVDHCHETGAVRGLLCFSCNKGLGLLGDNRVALQRALAYVSGAPMLMMKPDMKLINRAIASGNLNAGKVHRHVFPHRTGAA